MIAVLLAPTASIARQDDQRTGVNPARRLTGQTPRTSPMNGSSRYRSA